MDDKLNELKEKQAEIGDKISLLRQTNQRKDEEAAEIRKLIAECRENLNRIKGIAPGAEEGLAPCSGFEDLESRKSSGSSKKRDSAKDEQISMRMASLERSERLSQSESRKDEVLMRSESRAEPKRPCSTRSLELDRKRCEELLAKKDCKSRKRRDGERVSCKVDLNKMKVRIRGPPEDLKKLDATQLINLLEKYQCQELIINTGDEIIRDPGEVSLIYVCHPGNIVMVAGIVMIAFLINANLCNEQNKTKFLLNVLYLGSFAFHFGMVLCMSFIRGYALKFGLNPDTFCQVDNSILPKYFCLCVLLSALSLYSFMATHCLGPCTSWRLEVLAQMITLVVTFVMELTAICYIIPALIKIRGVTDDSMFDDEDPECFVPDSYEKNLVKLGKLNWTICLINFLTIVFLGANIYYITTKLHIGD